MTDQPTPPQPEEPAGAAPPPPAAELNVSQDVTPLDSEAKTMGMLCHLLGIFTGFLGALIIWLIKKDDSPFVDDQGKEALNFQITVMIAYIASSFLMIIFIGILLLPVIGLLNLILCIMGAVKANQGVAYRYPLNIRFIK